MNFVSKPIPKQEPQIDIRRKKVLIIEDFFAFRLTLKKMLRSFDMTDLDDASTGEDALQDMSNRKYDIILCDYNLGPGKNGQQVLEEARYRNYIGHSTIFIMITAENTMDVFMGSLEYRADDYLIKPITKDSLERKLQEWVRKKNNLKEIERALEKSDLDGVLDLCDELIGKNPKNLSEVLKIKGDVLLKKGDFEEAASFYADVLTKGNLPWAALGSGKAAFHAGDYERAESIFREIIRKNANIVAAHDMLAQVLEKRGNPLMAQKILEEAVRISPKAILRQKTLGKLSYRNKDLITAEKSFKEVVKQGKNSVLKNPADYTSLAKVLIDKEVPEQSLGVLQEAQREFLDDREAAVRISVTEAFAFKKLNREDEFRKAVKRASEISATLSTTLPAEAALDLAKAFYMTGNEERAVAVVTHVVQNNQNNSEVIETIQGMYKDLDKEEEGKGIIRTALNEIVRLNNEGVRMVREGRYEAAIELFEKAADRLPANKVINANAAHAVMLSIRQNGTDRALLEKALKYLDAVKQEDPYYGRLKELTEMYDALSRGSET